MTDTLSPVQAEVVVPVDPDTAFRLYVTRPGRQHPAEGQSAGPAEIVYEPFAGGRWFEHGQDGREYKWGRVLVWEPPHRLVLAWMVGAAAGTWAYDPDPDHASRAELTFEPAEGGTRVRVVHTGFEAHGAGAESIRRGVGGGNDWAHDLSDLARAAESVSAPPIVTGAQVNLFCDHVESTLAFYTALGLIEAFRYPVQGAPEAVEVEAAGIRIGLHAAAVANRLADLGVASGADPASAELALWVDDVEAMFATAIAAGATALAAPTDSPDGRLRYGWVHDPEGHQIKFIEQT
ncbi:SRPBCC domain-containing protein [Nesterenkonia ebinurensis]|uniref:SRPBCC domain-containing protein n=1 Tax=Nesterenkonia ebinurensis TaxID=2608252 RepID=UPI00123D3144|nr:SRPBCC domain-containing protein [Nesterenkonia ebinurensis]